MLHVCYSLLTGWYNQQLSVYECTSHLWGTQFESWLWHGRTYNCCVSVWDDQQMLKGIVNFYYAFQIHPDTFRQVTAIFWGLHVPYKLLQYCLCFGRMYIMVRLVWPGGVGAWGFGPWGAHPAPPPTNYTAIRPKHRQYWSSLYDTVNPEDDSYLPKHVEVNLECIIKIWAFVGYLTSKHKMLGRSVQLSRSTELVRRHATKAQICTLLTSSKWSPHHLLLCSPGILQSNNTTPTVPSPTITTV
jgi:hypothetical protein